MNSDELFMGIYHLDLSSLVEPSCRDLYAW